MANGFDPKTFALMQMGAGMLSGGAPSYGPPKNFMGILGGAAPGALSSYMMARQMQEKESLSALQKKKLEFDMEQARLRQAALQGLVGGQPTGAPQPQAGVSDASAGAMGAPWAARSAQPQQPQGFQPIPLSKLAQAAAGGVDVSPFLKMNEASMPKTRDINVGNEVLTIDERTNNVVSRRPMGAAPGAKPYEAQDIGPQAFRDFLTSKASAGANKNTMNVQNFTPASEEAQKEFMKSTRTNYEAVRNAPTVLKNIDAAKALIPSAKSFMGPGGETMLEAAKFLNNRLGMSVDTKGVKDAEELRSRVFFQLMENLKKMDAQPSQMQQIMMRDALGKLGTDPNALGAVLDAYGSVVKDKVSIHNKEVRSAQERGVKFPYDPIIELRQSGGGKVTDAMQAMPPPSKHRGRIIEDSQGNRYKSDGMKWQKM